MKFIIRDDPETYQAVYQAIQDIRAAKVWPYPGVVQETLATRGVVVDMDVDEDVPDEAVVRVVRKKA